MLDGPSVCDPAPAYMTLADLKAAGIAVKALCDGEPLPKRRSHESHS